jgi:hypothetical protein
MYWSGECEWFTFTFVGYDSSSGRHKVSTGPLPGLLPGQCSRRLAAACCPLPVLRPGRRPPLPPTSATRPPPPFIQPTTPSLQIKYASDSSVAHIFVACSPVHMGGLPPQGTAPKLPAPLPPAQQQGQLAGASSRSSNGSQPGQSSGAATLQKSGSRRAGSGSSHAPAASPPPAAAQQRQGGPAAGAASQLGSQARAGAGAAGEGQQQAAQAAPPAPPSPGAIKQAVLSTISVIRKIIRGEPY